MEDVAGADNRGQSSRSAIPFSRRPSLFGEAEITASADDDVVEEGNAQYSARFHEARGESPVLGRGSRVPARVVVPTDDSRRPLPDGGAENLSRIDRGARQRTPRYGHFAE